MLKEKPPDLIFAKRDRFTSIIHCPRGEQGIKKVQTFSILDVDCVSLRQPPLVNDLWVLRFLERTTVLSHFPYNLKDCMRRIKALEKTKFALDNNLNVSFYILIWIYVTR